MGCCSLAKNSFNKTYSSSTINFDEYNESFNNYYLKLFKTPLCIVVIMTRFCKPIVAPIGRSICPRRCQCRQRIPMMLLVLYLMCGRVVSLSAVPIYASAREGQHNNAVGIEGARLSTKGVSIHPPTGARKYPLSDPRDLHRMALWLLLFVWHFSLISQISVKLKCKIK